MEQVRRLILGGATLIQLRDKYAPAGEFYRSAVEAVGYAHQRDVKILINDRTDIALAAAADGVHLGQDDLSPAHARDLLGPTAIIGFSTHSLEQARAALAMPIDYLAIGPIFPTLTKDDADPVVGTDGLRSLRELDRNFPIVAIGGISRDNYASVLSAGADCVAMIGDLVADPSTIADRMRELRNL